MVVLALAAACKCELTDDVCSTAWACVELQKAIDKPKCGFTFACMHGHQYSVDIVSNRTEYSSHSKQPINVKVLLPVTGM
jgi:hypothetical protein